MIREDFMELEVLSTKIAELVKRSKDLIIGCGKYFKLEDKYCGHRYNWKNTKKFKMDVWLCKKCNFLAKGVKKHGS